MKTIDYRITFTEPPPAVRNPAFVRVDARDINSGFRKAILEATRLYPYELAVVEFWQVVGGGRRSR